MSYDQDIGEPFYGILTDEIMGWQLVSHESLILIEEKQQRRDYFKTE